MSQEDISKMNSNVIDSYDDVTTDSATVRMENTRKATKRISVDDVKELRHSVMVNEAEDTPRGRWNHRR
jgi:hypothetical protein